MATQPEADDVNETAEKPDGWRPEWRLPKKRGARAREESIALATEPLPSAHELADEARCILRSIAGNATASSVARVAAAKALLETASEDPEAVVERLLGSPEAFLAWIDRIRPGLARRVDALRQGQ